MGAKSRRLWGDAMKRRFMVQALEFYSKATPQALEYDAGRVARFALHHKAAGRLFQIPLDDLQVGEEVVIVGDDNNRRTCYVLQKSDNGAAIAEEVDIFFGQRNLVDCDGIGQSWRK